MYLKWFIFYIIFKYSSSQFIVKPWPKNASIMVPRIIGGRPAKLGDVPYQVAFKTRISRRSNRYVTFCGGVIIAPRKLLTAAHCFEGRRGGLDSDCCSFSSVKQVEKNKLISTYAVAGNLFNVVRHPRWRSVMRARKPRSAFTSMIQRKPWGRIPSSRRNFSDPSYSNKTKCENRTEYDIRSKQRSQSDIPIERETNYEAGQWRLLSSGIYPTSYRFPKQDIAVIMTKRAFRYNNYVRPIPIASKYVDYDMSCLASGYGRIDSRNLASQLLLADLYTVRTPYCNRLHRQNMIRFICTTSRISDTAKGDSGGPLVCKKTGDPNDKGAGVVVGIVSGHRVGAGSFFTRVSTYKSFILSNEAVRNENSIVFVFLTIYTEFCLF